ncbi:MAG: ArsA-related P-loop ATPase [Actinomycetota bacterium]
MADRPAPLLDVLADRRVVLCLGSGGVGKTTTAAAVALGFAARGERAVVLTIDPARRLADALGLGGGIGNEAVRLPAPNRSAGRGEAWAAMLDPSATLEGIVRDGATDAAQAERILSNRLFRNLTSSLSGTNEYMAAERLHQLHQDERFDRVIVDTPPSRHAIDFLDSPGRLTRFVDHRLYRSVFAPRHSLLRPFNAGSQVIMRLLGRLVGTSLVDDVVEFFAEFEGLDREFRRRAAEIEAVLAGPTTAHVLVAAPREDRLAEARWIAGKIADRDRSLDAVIMNRVVPVDIEAARAAMAEAESLDLIGPLAQNLDELAALATQEAALADRLRATIRSRSGRAVPIVRVAEQATPVRDLDGLRRLAGLL